MSETKIYKNDLIYLASPYSKYPGGRDTAYELACQKAADLMLQGFKVFCPIAHSHAVERVGMYPNIQDGDWWLEQDFAVLKNCSALFVYKMKGWDESYGVAKEIEFANDNKIPIVYVDD